MVCYDPYTAELYPQTQPIMPAAMKITPQAAAEEAFEREKAAITSYEQGWDRWDGPIWPVGYVQCRMQADDYHHAPTTPTGEHGAKTPDRAEH